MRTNLLKILKEEKQRILLLHQNQGYGGKKLIREAVDKNGLQYVQATQDALFKMGFPKCIAKYGLGVYYSNVKDVLAGKGEGKNPKVSLTIGGTIYNFYPKTWRANVQSTGQAVDYYCLTDLNPRIGRPTIEMMRKNPQITWKYTLEQLEAASKSCPSGQVYDETVGKCTLQSQEVTASATGQAAAGQAAAGQAAAGQAAAGQAAAGQAAAGQAAAPQTLNNNVTSVQTALTSAGFSVGQKGADGRMGADTLTAINQLIAKYTELANQKK
jgi:hypothetical protein